MEMFLVTKHYNLFGLLDSVFEYRLYFARSKVISSKGMDAMLVAESVLSHVPIFQGLSDDVIDAIEERCSHRSIRKNTVILNEGDDSDALYIIKEGKVKAFLCDETGKELILNVHGPYEYFGELALIDNEKRSASVMTTEKSAFLVLHRDDFKALMDEYPELMHNLLSSLVSRVRSLTDNVKTLALLDVYGRVAKTLLSLAHNHDGCLSIDEKLTQQDIADRVGASREMVAKIMKDLSVGGYISYNRRQIVINERLPAHY